MHFTARVLDRRHELHLQKLARPAGSTVQAHAGLELVSECMQALTSACLAGLSDIVAQRIVSRGALNWRRTAALAVCSDSITFQTAPLHACPPACHISWMTADLLSNLLARKSCSACRCIIGQYIDVLSLIGSACTATLLLRES